MIKLYTRVYNALSVVLWIVVVYSAIWQYKYAYKLTTVSQILNILDILHALTGITKSASTPAIMQAASRLTSLTLTSSTSHEPWVRVMMAAWGVADAIRFAYYLYPDGMQWLRYNLFIVLYPVGFACEMIAIFKSEVEDLVKYGLLAGWPVGFYFMYSHMFRQRRKLASVSNLKTSVKSK